MSQSRQEVFREKYHAGLELISEGKHEEAMALLYEAAKIAPEGWLALANELIKDGKPELAEDRCKEILKLTKDFRILAAAYNNLGMIYCAKGLLTASEEAFNESRNLVSTSPDPLSNLALIHQWRQCYPESIRYASRALAIDPWHEQAQFIRSMCLLLSGDYVEGFKEYECRWRSKNNGLSKLNCNMPEWNGKNGKSVFIYGEQGHGDSILMMRYAKQIKAMGLKQSWVTQKSMSDLIRTISEIDCVVEVGDPLPDFDCHLPAVSLPRVLGTTTSNIETKPYVPKPADAVDYGEGFHVGISWRGSPSQTNDLIRSSSLKQWSDLLNVPGVTFHSLQAENAEQVLLYPEIKTYPAPSGWLETARRMAGLDLVISVDTAIVHLAGSMGIQCLCALHSRPYFVYPPKFGDITPWYDSVKLFRARKEHDWDFVFNNITNELIKRTSRRSA